MTGPTEGADVVTIILALEGLNLGQRNQVAKAFGYGALLDEANMLVTVDYPRIVAKHAIPTGALNLDAALRPWINGTDHHVEVRGFSEGAQVASLWLKRYATAPDAPPADRLSFLLYGNPQRRFGADLTRKYSAGGKLFATPETQYAVRDVARISDKWANADRWTPKGRKFSLADRLRFITGAGHTSYGGVDLSGCWVREISGNTDLLVKR